MRLLNIAYGGDFAHHAFYDTFPIVLRERVQTCIENYENEKNSHPNVIVLSNEVRTVLFNAGLISVPLSVSSIQERDFFAGDRFKLAVYHTNELPKNEKPSIEKKFSENPETICIGKTSWWGLGKSIKGSSLKEYHLSLQMKI